MIHLHVKMNLEERARLSDALRHSAEIQEYCQKILEGDLSAEERGRVTRVNSQNILRIFLEMSMRFRRKF
jgi:hypothetical protein